MNVSRKQSVFDAILIIAVALSGWAIYGRWQARRNAPAEFKCWSELYSAQKETYLSLGSWERQQFNFASCSDSEVILTQLGNYPASHRSTLVDKLIAENHGSLPHIQSRWADAPR